MLKEHKHMRMCSATKFSHENIAKDIFTHISNFNTNKLKHVIIQTKIRSLKRQSRYMTFLYEKFPGAKNSNN